MIKNEPDSQDIPSFCAAASAYDRAADLLLRIHDHLSSFYDSVLSWRRMVRSTPDNTFMYCACMCDHFTPVVLLPAVEDKLHLICLMVCV